MALRVASSLTIPCKQGAIYAAIKEQLDDLGFHAVLLDRPLQ
jgi:hypothetical protein